MRIGYLVNQYPAPSHTFIRREIQALEGLGVEVERYTLRHCQEELVESKDLEEKKRTHCILLGAAWRLPMATIATACLHPLRFVATLKLSWMLCRNSPRGIAIQLAYLTEAARLLQWVRRHRVTHLHAHFGTNSTSVVMLCNSLGGPPYSFMVHGPDDLDSPREISMGLKISRASFVATISNYARSQLYRWCPLHLWDKIHIVPCGIDARFAQENPPPVPASNRFLWAGRITEVKGLPILLDACRILHAAGVGFEIVLAGEGPLKGVLQERIQGLGLREIVHFAGWLNDAGIKDALENSIALIIPSFAEGLPVILMEALARSRPAIATRIAAIPELLVDGECGWIVSPGNAEELATAMRKALATSPEDLSMMGALGRSRVLERHDVDRSARILADLFAG